METASEIVKTSIGDGEGQRDSRGPSTVLVLKEKDSEGSVEFNPSRSSDLLLTGDEEGQDEDEEEEEEELEDPFSEFVFTLPSTESTEEYIELSPIEQARQHRIDFDLKVPKCILRQRDIVQLFSAFQLIDTKNSGYIGTRGISMLFGAMGIEPSRAEVGAAIGRVSKRKKSKLTFKEFLELIKNKVEERDKLEGLQRGFDSMDFSGKKALTFQELKMAARLLHENLDREEGQEMIREADKDRDGVVNFEDFCKTINKLNIYI